VVDVAFGQRLAQPGQVGRCSENGADGIGLVAVDAMVAVELAVSGRQTPASARVVELDRRSAVGNREPWQPSRCQRHDRNVIANRVPTANALAVRSHAIAEEEIKYPDRGPIAHAGQLHADSPLICGLEQPERKLKHTT